MKRFVLIIESDSYMPNAEKFKWSSIFIQILENSANEYPQARIALTALQSSCFVFIQMSNLNNKKASSFDYSDLSFDVIMIQIFKRSILFE